MYSYPEYHESDDIISFLREHYHSNEDINIYEYYPPQEKAIDYLEKRKPETTNKLKKDLNFQIKTENKVTGITENISHKGKKITFKIFKGKKRGRQISFDPKRKEHSWDSSDLLKNKLQRNYITYLINLANDVTNNHLSNKKYVIYFKDIKYAEKIKTIKRDDLVKLQYKDIFEFQISQKNKGINKKGKTNKDIYDLICKESSLLKEFFDKRYLEVFENYYLTNKRSIIYKGINIILSEKTKTFENLLNKDRNVLAKSKINDIIENLYLKNNIIIEIGLKED